MIKVAAAVIKYEDKILLMRRAPGQAYAGFWEFPGGKVENGERASAALKRELDEELYIDAKVGKLITSVKHNEYEIFAYDVKYYDGKITLHVHDDMQWVPLNKALEFNLLPADRKIVMFMTNTKVEKQKPETLETRIAKIIENPTFDNTTQRYVVKIKNPLIGQSRDFATQAQAVKFYMDTVRDIIKSSIARQY